MKAELISIISKQVNINFNQERDNELEIINVLKKMSFPLIIKCDLPI